MTRLWSVRFFLALVFLLAMAGCAGRRSPQIVTVPTLASSQLQEKIRRVVSSVVGVAAVFDYRIEFFNHELVNGKYVTDAASPTGYRLVKDETAITVTPKIQKVNGGGLMIHRDDKHALILTSHHILMLPDTLLTFERDAAGNITNVLFSRAIKKRATYHVLGQLNQLEPAEVLYTDARADLALITTTALASIGMPFPYTAAYKTEVKWGDLAYVFGYPREIKQLTLGVISPAPYPGSFALNVVGRFGFSGGPVFLIQPDGELALAGIIRGVPVSKLQYIAPPPKLLPGEHLVPEDITRLRVEEMEMIEYGIVYAIGAERIGRFLKDSLRVLERKGIFLPAYWLP
ncbi:MAG: serine protease [candidate division KSB1 bacterium]|nr:serine protease [candidate division KSB1 bacterium]